jgi:hypothetical protein
MTVLAICEGSDPDPVGGALIVLAVLVFYVAPVVLAFKAAAPRNRGRLGQVYVVAIGISVLFGLVIPGGLSGTGADYLGLFFGGLAVGGAFGALMGFRFPENLWQSALLGVLGGGSFLVAVTGLLFFAFETSGACIG